MICGQLTNGEYCDYPDKYLRHIMSICQNKIRYLRYFRKRWHTKPDTVGVRISTVLLIENEYCLAALDAVGG